MEIIFQALKNIAKSILQRYGDAVVPVDSSLSSEIFMKAAA